jgi:methyl-accepting chemotaxis protein
MDSIALRPLMPGILLMRRLRIPVKLALMGLMLLAPLTVLVVSSFLDAREGIKTAQRELVGARQTSLLVDVAVLLQAHRDLAVRTLAATDEIKTKQSAVLSELRAKVAELNAPPSPLLTVEPQVWSDLQVLIADIAEGRAPQKRNELFAFHSRAIASTQRQMQLTAEASGLLLDPEAGSYYLMDLSTSRLVPFLEALSLARGQGSAALARGDANTAERATMLVNAEQIGDSLARVQLRLDSLKRLGHSIPGEWEQARIGAEQFAAKIRSVFTAEAIDAEPAAFFDLATEALATGAKLEHRATTELIQQLETRVVELTARQWRDLGLSLLGTSAVIYLALSFYFSFAGAVRVLQRGMERVAAGDLSQHMVIHGRDELAEIGSLVERMNGRLSALVAEIRSSAVRVTMSGEQVASGSQALADRTEKQAASLRDAVATVQQLSVAVAASADEAQHLDQITARLRDQAAAGGKEMQESIAAMSALEDGSRRVGEIIGVIDGIAFQTNILALNAAVEAARAGEAGRGFAVVATEVRQLAQRSSAASAEIRGLIARSSEQVDMSVRRTKDVGGVLTSLVDGVRKVSRSLQEIAQASGRQSTDLREVTAAVGNLDEITRQNAGMVDQSTAAAGELVSRADALRNSVAMIKLRQGSADEARALVLRALDVVGAQGLQAARAALQSREQGFVDRDLYVFVVDSKGTYVVHGAKPAMEGRRVHDLPGIDGDRFVRDGLAACEAGGGWVDYEILNPESGIVQPKVSFVMPLEGVGMVGCGFYRTNVLAEA